MTTSGEAFWQAVAEVTDPTAYRPRRNVQVEAARLDARPEPYYILKEPLSKSYLRLSEPDYALWWQMDGRRSLKDLLFYSLVRYNSLPIGHLNSLVADLRAGNFLADTPTDLYGQVSRALTERAPASRGRRILDGFLHSEWSITGLDDFFTPLYGRLRWLFWLPVQILLLGVILVGGYQFGGLLLAEELALAGSGGWSLLTLLLANIIVITLHELAHGLTTKQFGRELDKGGILIYWGFPAFFVDTRDIWLSPRHHRIAVSWAGPHSGLVLGGLAGLLLTWLRLNFANTLGTAWVGLIYQVGFIAYLTVFVNLNPLLELDGYFILMDWLDIPRLRERAIRFWRTSLWGKLKANPNPAAFWRGASRAERVFTFYGGLTLAYSVYALAFALYFWRSRLGPFAAQLWGFGWWGQLLVMGVTAVLILPALYFISQYAWSRAQAGLEWLARRDLLARPDVLTLLTGLPLLVGLPLLFVALSRLPNADLWAGLVIWALHLAAIAVFVGVARQVPGSRFQWALWLLTAVPLILSLNWLGNTLMTTEWRQDWLLLAAGTAVLAAGLVGWFTVKPRFLETADQVVMAGLVLLGTGYGWLAWSGDGRLALPLIALLLTTFGGLLLLTPLWINFWRSRFALPWFLIILGILALPLLNAYPVLHLPIITLWAFAGGLYLLLGELAQFSRFETTNAEADLFSERERLTNSFNHFLQAMFRSYERVFGGRRLAAVQAQIQALGPIDPDDTILEIGERCRLALLLAVDRLDDLAGTPFTRQAGQAAYDSLPWLEAETLARHALADMAWGAQLAQGFIQQRDRRRDLVRRADIFAGFDREAVRAVLAVLEPVTHPKRAHIAAGGEEAVQFYLVESGEVGVFHENEQIATLHPGGYFGVNALLDSGHYHFTYRALTPVRLLGIARERFDPLLRADTTLSAQVTAGAEARHLLKQMPLFGSLSPQELEMVDRRLQQRRVKAGEVIVRQGEPRSYLFIVLDGRVEVVMACDGRAPQVVGSLGVGEHFGEYALYADTPYTATYRAAEDCRLLLLDEPTFDRLAADYDTMSHYVEQIGSGRLITTRRRLGATAVLS